jgi:hypothetical protein
MIDLNQLLASLSEERDDAYSAAAQSEKMAKRQRHTGDMIAARIRGIEEAMEALGSAAVEPIPQRPRKRRRNIRAMVKQFLEPGTEAVHTPEFIATQIGCKQSQVEAALEFWSASGRMRRRPRRLGNARARAR